MYNLQQYAQILTSKGFGYDLIKFAHLSDSEIDTLAVEIKILPGHKTKLLSLIQHINSLLGERDTLSMYTSGQKFRNTSQSLSRKSKPKTSQTVTRPKAQTIKVAKISNIGCDFFQESGIDDEFQEVLNNIMEKYKNEPMEKQRTITSGVTSNLNQTSRLNQTIGTQRKAYDDINIVTKFNVTIQKDEPVLRQNRLMQNLQKKTSKQKKKPYQDEDEDYPDLQMSQIKHMYISYDTGKLTSTMVNLDIEEMCNCLSWAVVKHISYQKRQQSIMRNSSIPLSMEFKFRGTANGAFENSQNPIEEPTQLNYQYDQGNLFASQQIEKQQNDLKHNNTLGKISEKSDNTNYQQLHEILRESLIFKQKMQEEDEEDQYLNDQIYESCSDEDLPDSEYSPLKPITIPQQQPQRIGNISEMSLQQESQHYNYSQSDKEISLFQSKFDFAEIDDRQIEMQQLYLRQFYDPSQDNNIPSNEVIANYCKNIIITSKMEKEVTIICLVYLERLLLQGISLEPHTWRRVLLISMIIASKIWDDESFENDNFAKVFTQYRTSDINEMERIFLILIDYRLYVKSSDYAKYYFILRTYAESRKKSFPLRPLDLNTIMKLQKNANYMESNLRAAYQQKNNKSF